MESTKLATLLREHIDNIERYMSKTSQMRPVVGWEAEAADKGRKWLWETFALPDAVEVGSGTWNELATTGMDNIVRTWLFRCNEWHAMYPVNPVTQEAVLNAVERLACTGPTMWSHFEVQQAQMRLVKMERTTLEFYRFCYFSLGYRRFCAALQYFTKDGSNASKPNVPTSARFFEKLEDKYEEIGAAAVMLAAFDWNQKTFRLNEGHLLAVKQVKLLAQREPEAFSYRDFGSFFRLTYRGKDFTRNIEGDPVGKLPEKLLKTLLANGTAGMLQPEDINNVLTIYNSAK